MSGVDTPEVGGGLSEREREAVATLFPTPGFYADTVALVERIVAARDAVWADRLAAVQVEVWDEAVRQVANVDPAAIHNPYRSA